MHNKKQIWLTLIISVCITLFGILIFFWIENKKISKLENIIENKLDYKIDSNSKSDLLSLQNALISMIQWAWKSVVSITISKNMKTYGDDPSVIFKPWTSSAKVGGGSWIIVRKDWYIITSKHVVQDTSAKYSITLSDGKIYNVDKIWFDDILDVAILRVVDNDGNPVNNLPTANIAEIENNIQIGQFVFAIWNALSEYPNTFSMWILSARNKEFKINKTNVYVWLYQSNLAINPGNSGGPLIDINWNVIALNTAESESNGISFSLPISKEFVDTAIASVEKYNKITRPLIWIQYVDINDPTNKLNGIQVKDVLADFPGKQAGIEIGDVISAVNGKQINKNMPFLYQLYTYMPGDKINLTVERNGEKLEFPVVLGENN